MGEKEETQRKEGGNQGRRGRKPWRKRMTLRAEKEETQGGEGENPGEKGTQGGEGGSQGEKGGNPRKQRKKPGGTKGETQANSVFQAWFRFGVLNKVSVSVENNFFRS